MKINTISDAEFEKYINESMDELPKEYIDKLDNVAIVIEDDPSEEQRSKLELHNNQTLFGLYQGIPLTQRGSGYNLVLPDKITIFRNPIVSMSRNKAELKEHVKRTLWHEIAHYYGLGHDRIHELEQK